MRFCNGPKTPAFNIDAAGKQDPLCDEEGDAQQGRAKGRETRQYAEKEAEGAQKFDEREGPSEDDRQSIGEQFIIIYHGNRIALDVHKFVRRAKEKCPAKDKPKCKYHVPVGEPPAPNSLPLGNDRSLFYDTPPVVRSLNPAPFLPREYNHFLAIFNLFQRGIPGHGFARETPAIN